MKKFELIGKYFDMCNQLWVEIEPNVVVDSKLINKNRIIEFDYFDELEEWVESNNYEFFGVNYIVREC